MSVRFVRGDLFADGSPRAIAHGCNCAGAMGKGIAVEFRADGRTVFNLGTEKTWRTKAKLADVETALRAMVKLAERDGVGEIGLPRIGAGLGALPWADVRELIERIGFNTTVALVVFEHHASGDVGDGDSDSG